MTLIKYSIANQFSRKPGPRYKEQGKNSGQEFLEESFGGLSRRRDKEIILKTLQFISTEEPYLIDEIKQYINEAKQLQLV